MTLAKYIDHSEKRVDENREGNIFEETSLSRILFAIQTWAVHRQEGEDKSHKAIRECFPLGSPYYYSMIKGSSGEAIQVPNQKTIHVQRPKEQQIGPKAVRVKQNLDSVSFLLPRRACCENGLSKKLGHVPMANSRFHEHLKVERRV